MKGSNYGVFSAPLTHAAWLVFTLTYWELTFSVNVLLAQEELDAAIPALDVPTSRFGWFF